MGKDVLGRISADGPRLFGGLGARQSSAGRQILTLIREYKIRPNHLRGQNFLIDDEVYEQILAAAGLNKNDTVFEIGAGLGTLTSRLATRAGRVIAVEVDSKLVSILRHCFAKTSNIEVVEQEILSLSVAALLIEKKYKVVANIPYYLTGKLLRKFLGGKEQPEAMTLLVQKEVAERLVAKAGQLSLPAINAQLYSEPRIIATVSRTSFFPAPAVDSAIIQFNYIHPFPFADCSEKFFWQVVKIGFASPRKQLKNNLAAGFPRLTAGDLKKIKRTTGIKLTNRAEAIDIDLWHALVVALIEVGQAVQI